MKERIRRDGLAIRWKLLSSLALFRVESLPSAPLPCSTAQRALNLGSSEGRLECARSRRRNEQVFDAARESW